MRALLVAFLILFASPAFALDIDEMLAWIAENSDYDTEGIPIPTIRIVTGEDLQVLYYGRLPNENEVFLTVEAIYMGDDEIWIREGIEGNAYQMTVLHELVHHVQEYSDKEFACIAASEADAYELGDRYSVEVLDDESLKSDPLVVMFLTQCARW